MGKCRWGGRCGHIQCAASWEASGAGQPRGKRWALRDGDWKLIFTRTKNRDKAKIELFNIALDPNEKNDLAEKNPEKTAELQGKLDEQRKLDLSSRGGL